MEGKKTKTLLISGNLSEEIDKSTSKSSENYALFLFFLFLMLVNVSNTLIKLVSIEIKTFNIFIFVGFRLLVVSFWSFAFMKFKNIKPQEIKQEDKFYFYLRIISFSGVVFFGNMTFMLLRFGTANCLALLTPIWNVLIGILIFKEEFQRRIILGCIMCFTGTVFMSLNEKSGSVVERTSSEVFLGVLCGLILSVAGAVFVIATKHLSTKYDSYYLNTLLTLCSGLILLCFAIFGNHFVSTIFNLRLFGWSMLISIPTFIGFHVQILSFKHLNIIQTTMLCYVSLIITAIMGYIIFQETFALIDYVGAGLIIAYNVYDLVVTNKNDVKE